jgi:hypothetical protein
VDSRPSCLFLWLSVGVGLWLLPPFHGLLRLVVICVTYKSGTPFPLLCCGGGAVPDLLMNCDNTREKKEGGSKSQANRRKRRGTKRRSKTNHSYVRTALLYVTRATCNGLCSTYRQRMHNFFQPGVQQPTDGVYHSK